MRKEVIPRKAKALVLPKDKTLRELIQKYSGNTPRYTSYPTALEFSDAVDTKAWHAALSDEIRGEFRPSLYLHLPFCHSLCYFCACNKKIARDDSQVQPYISALRAELEAYKSIIPRAVPLQQLHWGGGTPNFLSPGASVEVYEICRELFSELTEDADVSVEIDPRSLRSHHLETYKQLGFNRLSLGVQDFNERVQVAINRIQPFEQVRDTCAEARNLGFSSINFDLIYGLPLQERVSFSRTLEQVISLRPERIALYGYAHVTWKKKVQKSLQRHDLPSPEDRVELFLLALGELISAGYRYIGMDHFALPEDSLSRALDEGNLNRNFMGYSTHKGTSVIGAGVSAISSCSSVIAQNTSDFDEYLSSSSPDNGKICRGLSRSFDDQIRCDLIEHILCQGHLDFPEFEKRWSVNFVETFEMELIELKKLEKDVLVEMTDNSVTVTSLGRLFMRNIASKFDTYLSSHVAKKSFSQSI